MNLLPMKYFAAGQIKNRYEKRITRYYIQSHKVGNVIQLFPFFLPLLHLLFQCIPLYYFYIVKRLQTDWMEV